MGIKETVEKIQSVIATVKSIIAKLKQIPESSYIAAIVWAALIGILPLGVIAVLVGGALWLLKIENAVTIVGIMWVANSLLWCFFVWIAMRDEDFDDVEV